MKKRLIIMTLVLLFVLPSLCLASEEVKEAQSSFYCAYAKEMAINYVLDLKEKYINDTTNFKYLDAKVKYQIAAAKFSGLKSTLEIDIISGKYVPNVNDPKYKVARYEALKAYYDFEASSQTALGISTTKRPDVYKSTKDRFTKEIDDKNLPVDEFTIPAVIPAVLPLIVDGISIAGSVQELWVKNNNIRDAKLTKLTGWLNDYYEWPNWNAIEKTATVTVPK